MELLNKLGKAGLTGNEAKLYLGLLKKGQCSANELSKLASMDRTLTYQVLDNLKEKGLVSYIIKNNKKYFKASAPKTLLNPVKEKERFVGSLVSELENVEKTEKTDQEIRVYEGKHGLKVFFEEIISKKGVLIFGATGKSYDILKFELPHLIEKAKKLGMKGKMITSKKLKGHEMTKISGLEIRYLEEVGSPSTTTIYGNKVGIHVPTDKPTIIIIRNKDIAQSYREYFDVLWCAAKK